MAKHGLPGPHPVHIPLHRVDFAVVGDESERVSQVPGGEGVRAVALVHEGDRRFKIGLGQVEVVRRNLGGQQQPLVNERLGRQAGDVEEPPLCHVAGRDLLFHPLADHVQLPLERLGVGGLGAPADKYLSNLGLHLRGGRSQRAIVAGHIAPPQEDLSLFADDALEHPLAGVPLIRLTGQEDQPGAVFPRGPRQADVRVGADPGEESRWHLHQDAGPVSRVVFAATRAAVLEVDQDPHGVVDQLMRRDSLDIRDKSHAAGVVLIRGVIQPLGGGRKQPMIGTRARHDGNLQERNNDVRENGLEGRTGRGLNQASLEGPTRPVLWARFPPGKAEELSGTAGWFRGRGQVGLRRGARRALPGEASATPARLALRGGGLAVWEVPETAASFPARALTPLCWP